MMQCYVPSPNYHRLWFSWVDIFNSTNVVVRISTTDFFTNYLTSITFALLVVHTPQMGSNFYQFQGLYSSPNPANETSRPYNLATPPTFNESIPVSLCITSF